MPEELLPEDFFRLVAWCNTTERSEFNKLLRSTDSMRMLSALGIHIGIFGFIDYDSSPPSLFYLTEDDLRSRADIVTHRSVEWPFLVRDVTGRWNFEDSLIAKFRMKYVGRIRRTEFAVSTGVSTSPVDERLGGLKVSTALSDLLTRGSGDQFTGFERHLGRCMYSPMGEILFGILGWHLLYFSQPHLESWQSFLDSPLRQRLAPQESLTGGLLKSIKMDPADIALWPTAALVIQDHFAAEATRGLTWRALMQDMGFIRASRPDEISGELLASMVHWLTCQADSSHPLCRPTVHNFLKPSGGHLPWAEHLGSVDNHALFLEIVRRFHGSAETPRDWESRFVFGFANHLFWLSAGRQEENHSVQSYDWICTPVLLEEVDPAVVVSSRSAMARRNHFVRGLAFLTCDSLLRVPASEVDLTQFEFRIQQIIAYAQLLGSVESRHTYLLEIGIRNLATDLWRLYIDAFHHEIGSILGAARRGEESRSVELLREIVTTYNEWFVTEDTDILASGSRWSIWDEVRRATEWPTNVEIAVRKNITIEIDVPTDQFVSRTVVLGLAVLDIVKNAVFHAPENTAVRISVYPKPSEKSPEFLVVSNRLNREHFSPRVFRPSEWLPLDDIAEKSTRGRGVISTAASLLGLESPEFRVMEDESEIEIRLPLPIVPSEPSAA